MNEAFISAAWEVVKLQTELIEHLSRLPAMSGRAARIYESRELELRKNINRALAAMKAHHPK